MRAWAPVGALRGVAAGGRDTLACGQGVRIGRKCSRRLDADPERLMGKARQGLEEAARRVEVDQVLDPDAELAFEVDAGLDGEDCGTRQRCVGRDSREAWVLVRREADAVPRAVPEVLTVTGRLDDVARRGIRGATADR